MKKTIGILILIFAGLSLSGCGKKTPVPLRIACHDDIMPVVTLLGREYEKRFGLVVQPVHYDTDNFTVSPPVHFDLLITDDLKLVKRLESDGTINTMTGFGCATPAMVFRQEDHLAISGLDDLATLDRPVRMTVASEHATLSQIVKAELARNNVSWQGEDAKITMMPFLLEEIHSDGTRHRTTPETMLQQLRGKETDIVVFWDFVAAEAVEQAENGDSFVVVKWPPNAKDTITIPLCLLQDCTEFAGCKVFLDFVQSSRGRELLTSRSLSPSNNLIKDQW